jgi:hypothetical protein
MDCLFAPAALIDRRRRSDGICEANSVVICDFRRVRPSPKQTSADAPRHPLDSRLVGRVGKVRNPPGASVDIVCNLLLLVLDTTVFEAPHAVSLTVIDSL